MCHLRIRRLSVCLFVCLCSVQLIFNYLFFKFSDDTQINAKTVTKLDQILNWDVHNLQM